MTDPALQDIHIKGFMRLGEETYRCGDQIRTVQIYLHLQTHLEFVLVPGGPFFMGSPPDEKDRACFEGPRHEVAVRSFLLCRTPCTQTAWDRIGGEDNRNWLGADLPIERVTWHACADWCRKAGLRLPSEAEWEYACRADSTTRYSFGDHEADLDDHAWYGKNSDHRTHPVARKKPNAFGLHDMHGNVWEWCQDECYDTYRGAPADGSAWDSHRGLDRVERGGAWYDKAPSLRSAFRYRSSPDTQGAGLGFRPAAYY